MRLSSFVILGCWLSGISCALLPFDCTSPCSSHADCPPLELCTNGYALDGCGCCACARGVNESCGSANEHLSQKICGLWLYCNIESPGNATCAECESIDYGGCNMIGGECQCGGSCSEAFDFKDNQACVEALEQESEETVPDCSQRECPLHQLQYECPSDSYQTKPLLSEDGCCRLPQASCECYLCPGPPECSEYERLIQWRGNGQPGTCCSSYACANASIGYCEADGTFVDSRKSPDAACNECFCRNGVILCEHTFCVLPSCGWMSHQPGECCPTCLGCVSEYNREFYSNGEQWTEEDECISCQCVNGQPHCTANACSSTCANPRKVPGHCCPVCDNNQDNFFGTTMPEIMTTPVCDEDSDCPVNCSNIQYREINGCISCTCLDDFNQKSTSCETVGPNNVQYESGDSWFDGCRECFCFHGKEFCSLISCPRVTCSKPEIFPGECCSSCEDQRSGEPAVSAVNITIACSGAPGHRWKLDECTTCVCHHGQTLCENQQCPPILCSHPIKEPGKCCAECPVAVNEITMTRTTMDCLDRTGTNHSHGDLWRFGNCQSCSCRFGQVSCYSLTCPVLTCPTGVLKKGECCPQCLVERMLCMHGEEIYKENEFWTDDEYMCTCEKGIVKCNSCPPCTNNASPGCCTKELIEKSKDAHVPDGASLPTIVCLAVLLLICSAVIIILIVIVRKLKKRRQPQLTAIPKILELRALHNSSKDNFMKKRPRSTNLEFLHSTSENKYYIDRECFRPLVDTNASKNEYVHC